MKIGLACAGSGPGASYAYALAQELEALSLGPDMISGAAFSAAPMLLWSRGLSGTEIKSRMDAFHSSKSGKKAVDRLCFGLPAKPARCRAAINSADLDTGVIVMWADGLIADAQNIKVKQLAGMEREALYAALCPYVMEPPTIYGLRLGDFSARYGCPFFPLKMAGMERILSVVFTGGNDPAGIASESLSVLTGKNADLHYTIRLTDEENPEAIRKFLRERRDELYEKLLF